MVIAIAAAAVIAAVAIPLAVRSTVDRGTAPAGTGCPNPSPVTPTLPTSGGIAPYDGQEWADGLPAGPPPRVPYLVRPTGNGGGYLQDGRRRVALPADRPFELVGQVGCEWLVLEDSDASARAVSVLHADGSLTRKGTPTESVAISPDRTKIAFVPWRGNRIVLADIGSGRVLDQSTTARAGSNTYIWTKNGIWYADDNYHKYAYVWQPGSQPRKLIHDADEYLPVPSTDLVVLGETRNGTCIDILRLGPTALDRVMRHCGEDESTGLVSPDGKLLMTYGGTAYRIPENSRTSVDVPPSFIPIVWEDSTHVLLHAVTGTADKTGRETIVRCDAVSGSCERIFDAQRDIQVTIQTLK